MLAHKMKRAAGAGGPPTLTYIGQQSSTSDLTTYTFSGFVIPVPGLVIVAAAARREGNSSVSSFSIGGSAGTLVVTGSGEYNPCAIGTRVVTPGTIDVSFTLSGAGTRGACAVFLFSNYISSTAHASVAANLGVGTSISNTLNIPANGFSVHVVQTDLNPNNNAMSWSSASQTDQIQVETRARFAWAYKSVTSAISNHVETVSWSSNRGRGMASASWS